MKRKPWQLSAWKRKRLELLKGACCEWCGSTENLVIHHKRQIIPYALHRALVTQQLLATKVKEGEFKPLKRKVCPGCGYASISKPRKTMKPKYKCYRCGVEFNEPAWKPTGRLSREDWGKFITKYGAQIKETVLKQRDAFHERYMMLKREDVTILCRRCHLALHKGLDLCPVCKTHYKKRSYPMCWECFKKTEKGKRVLERIEERKEAERLIPYTHPWCGKEFMIEKQDWEIEASPRMCCIERCGKDVNNCEIAAKYWKES